MREILKNASIYCATFKIIDSVKGSKFILCQYKKYITKEYLNLLGLYMKFLRFSQIFAFVSSFIIYTFKMNLKGRIIIEAQEGNFEMSNCEAVTDEKIMTMSIDAIELLIHRL